MGLYKFKKHYYIRPLIEPLLCLFLCIPFWLFKDSIPDDQWGRVIFFIGGIPFLLIWLVDRIYKVLKHPKSFIFDLTSNSLIIDNAAYCFDDLKFFYISEKDNAFKMEFEFPSPKQLEAGYNLKTLSMYKLDSSLQEFNDSIQNMKHIKTFSSD
ncbi:hypothetical protein [Shewanella pneumatophori]|uniref:Uncharacterized protein n=1 Tax=Shewanella pneumatophori TaxID=314092 RepID=A0A9X1ZC77_9GAMM|nr:hypothetical protein [Shewanella pneumatophori]MCL1137610.1 hypothetical protein [Shewanella pneumatophori]